MSPAVGGGLVTGGQAIFASLAVRQGGAPMSRETEPAAGAEQADGFQPTGVRQTFQRRDGSAFDEEKLVMPLTEGG